MRALAVGSGSDGARLATLALLLAAVTLPEASEVCQGFDEMWGLCPDLPSCEECTPVDCEFGEWGDWYGATGDCTGLRFHERTIAVTHNECGKPCVGAKIESKEDVPERCLLQRVDCKLADWSAWSECQDGQVHRSRRVLAHASDGGEPCTASTEETVPCGRGPVPAHCEFSAWQDWTSCSSTCGGGRHTRMRGVLAEARHSGYPCEGPTLETKSCALQECAGTDCAMGDWSDWSMCDWDSHPQRYRRRKVAQAAAGGGACNQTLQETQGCPELEQQPCVLSEWSEWLAPDWQRPDPPACSRSCGGGQAFRTRNIKEQPSHGGRCPDASLRELKACNTQPCSSTPCEMSDWTAWSPCSARCGRGTKTRERQLVSPQEHFSEGCQGALEEALPCLGSDGDCPHTDCKWSAWHDWSVCTATCGGGMTQRSRAIESVPTGGGAACEALTKSEATTCATQPCGGGEACVDGLWGEWQEWQACTATCSSGYAMRSRAVAQEPTSCGRPPLGTRHEYKACSHLPPCLMDKDCELSDWSDWGACSATCYGVHERNRHIQVFPSGRGAHCNASLKEAAHCGPGLGGPAAPDCLPAAAPTDCALGSWGEWTACSKRCGGGQRLRQRKILIQPANGGRPCHGDLVTTTPCNSEPCEQEACSDCIWGMWSDWGDCSRCRGERYRLRSIEQMPNHCGKMCDLRSAKEISNCTGHCEEASFCAWTEWSEPAGCAGSCGHRTTMRSRALSLKPSGGDYLFAASHGSHCQGAQLNFSTCPPAQSCPPPCSPLDCAFSAWAEWTSPTSSGLCERSRSVSVTNNECGTPCIGPLEETKPCAQKNFDRRDCLLSDWATWGDCQLNGKIGQRHRSRSVVQQPSFDGLACGAALSETEQCSPYAPMDCKLSSWGMWDECARSCGGGWQSRARVLLAHAENDGRPCEGGLTEMRTCNVMPCEAVAVDCLYTDWQTWSGCGAHGQRYRARKVFRTASGGGKACTGQLEETASCSESLKVDCVVTEWTAWSLCDKSCGGGQAHRQRQITVFPKKGGAACPGELMQTTGCNRIACGVEDCLVSDWQAWSTCSASCGDGQQQRGRSIVRTRSLEGAGCNLELSQTSFCRGPPCPGQDCAWADWSEWGDCSASCGGGQQSRARSIAKMPSKNGRPCEAFDKEEVRPCSTQDCGKPPCEDGLWSDWREWSACSNSCGGGLQYRTREVARMANACGAPAIGNAREEKFCKVASCEPTYDCMFSEWEGWSDCSATCNGVMRRSRRVSQYGSGQGSFCNGPLKETWPCNPRAGEPTPSACSVDPPVDCLLSHWTDWSGCTSSCGGGEQTRSREVLKAPASGGRQCEEHLTVVRQCGLANCPGPDPVDCQYGPWEDWGACSQCGGERTRFRHIVQHARHGGKPCEPFVAESAGACPRQCEERQYCAWGDWAAWDECTARCGQGRRSRRRHLGLTSTPSALPAPVEEMMARYAELRRAAEDLETHGSQELLLAFVVGLLAFVLGLVGLRAFPVISAGLRQRGARSRTANELYDVMVQDEEPNEFSSSEMPLVSSA